MKKIILCTISALIVLCEETTLVYAQELPEVAIVCENDIDELPHLYTDETWSRALTTTYIGVDTKVCVRILPKSTAECVGYVYKDDIIHVIEIKDNWAMVKVNGEKRYIYAGHLKKK